MAKKSPFWWTTKQSPKQISFNLAELPYRPGSPGALAVARLAELDEEWAEVQTLYLTRLEKLDELKSIGTQPVKVDWQDDPGDVVTATVTKEEIATHQRIADKVYAQRRGIEQERDRVRGALGSRGLTAATGKYNFTVGEYYQHLHVAHRSDKKISCAECSRLLATIAVYGEWVRREFQELSDDKIGVFNG